MRGKEPGGVSPGQERSCYHIDDADADMEPFVLTAESIAPIRTRKLGIPVENSTPIFDIVLKLQFSPFTGASTFETMT